MDEPRRTRLILSLGAVIAVLLLVVVVQLAQRPQAPPAAPPPPPTPAVVTAPPLPVPAAPPTLRRADLIAAVSEATAAYAEGRLVADDRLLAPGRRFQIVIPFGCRGQGAAPDSHPAHATVDAKRRTLTLAAAPQDWSQAPWLKRIVGEAAPEAVEGFWVPRPWITGEACPAVPIPGDAEAAEAAPAPTPPTLGLVQVFYADASRVGQRGARPYRVVRKLTEEAAAAGPGAYRLVLAGRLAALVDNQTVRCFSESVEVRPTCVVGVELDKVRFEDAAGSETLAEWAE